MNRSTKSIELILDTCILDVTTGKQSIEGCLRAYPDIRNELEPLLTVAMQLNQAKEITAPDEFKSVAVTRLKNILQNQSVAQEKQATGFARLLGLLFGDKQDAARSSGRGWVYVVSALAVFVIFVGVMTTGAVRVSAQSLPGDFFYSTKLTFENLQLSINNTDKIESDLHIEFASRRMEEAARMVASTKFDKLDGVINDYALNILQSLKILLESETISDQERIQIAEMLEENLLEYEEFINVVFALTPEEYRTNFEETLMLARYGQDIVAEVLNRAPINLGVLPEIKPGADTISPPLEPTTVPTDTGQGTPEVATQVPRNEPRKGGSQKGAQITFSELVIEWWEIDPIKLPDGFVWPSSWPTLTVQLPEYPDGTQWPEIPELPDAPSTKKPNVPTERSPVERTPRPPRP